MGKEFVAAQVNKFKEQWGERLGPDVAVEWSDRYHRRGDLSEGVYAEIRKVAHQDMVSALKKYGIVID
eukprot:12938811-Prorocentrum_lima.AAC.1